jgi:predicted DCC family thiol-disulfide oxidoreductase YuxK
MSLWKWWLGYWFRPSRLFNLAICRLALVGAQMFLLHWFGTLDYAINLAKQASTGGESLFFPLLVYQLLTLPFGDNFIPSIEGFQAIYYLTLFAGTCSFLGLWTNPSLVVFAVGNIFLQAFSYSFGEIHHPHGLMMIALAILALSPCGEILSLDDLRRRLSIASKNRQFQSFNIFTQQSEFSRWPLLLIQWLFAVCYASAFWSKVREGGGIAWANGYTLQYYLVQDGFRFNLDFALWVAQFHYLVLALQWIVFIFQGTFFLAVLFPSVGWLYALLGISFHTGVYLSMGAPFFHWMSVYCVFFDWAHIFDWLKRRVFPTEEKMEVLYDGQCPLCIRSMTSLQYFDWFERITFSDVTVRWETLNAEHRAAFSLSDALREMYLLMPDGTFRKGFLAFKEMVRQMPFMWPIALVFDLPLASRLGPKVYHFVASRRFRFIQCTTDTCSLHTKKKSDAT